MVDLQKIEHARLLEGLSLPQLQTLGKIARESSFRAGEYVFKLGDKADAIFIIRAGTVSLLMPLTVLGVEKELPIEELAPGATVAWSALVPPHSLTMSARATVDVHLVGFGRENLHALFDEQPHLGRVLLGNLAAVVGRRLHLARAMWLSELQRSVSEKYK